MDKYKIVLLGEGGVGKSAITLRFYAGKFVIKYDPTIQDNYTKQIELDNESCVIDIQDTSGQNEFVHLTDQFIDEGHTFIIVYSITSERSFSRAKFYWKKIYQTKEFTSNSKPIAVLTGSKSDLEAEREVSSEQGMKFAKENNLEFCEVSAKENVNVSTVFMIAARLAREQTPAKKKKKTKKCQIL